MARVLVVDDSQTSLQLLDVLLFREGFEPYSCDGGEKAVELALKHKVDAAIFDLVSFEPTGLQLLRAFRQHPQLKFLPVILVLAASAPHERAAALAAGANDILTRPFDPQELFYRLRRLLQTIPPSSQGALQGDMARFFVGDVLQQLLAAGAEGVVEFVLPEPSAQSSPSSHAAMAVELSGATRGEVHVKNGRLWRAQFGRWQGEPALFAFLRVREGTFRFVERPVATEGQEPLELQEMLLNLAWLEDEVAAKQHLLPEQDAPLFPARRELEGPTKFLSSPTIFEMLREKPGQSLWDLWKEAPFCPTEVNAAVVELVEAGAITAKRPRPQELKRQLSATTSPGSGLTTSAISVLLESFLSRLARHAVRLGANPAAMQLLVLWPKRFWDQFLHEVVASIPRGVLQVPKEEILRDLAFQGSSSLRFAGADGAALIHLFRCSGLAALQAKATAKLAIGAVVGWAEADETELRSVLPALPLGKTILVPAHEHPKEKTPPSLPFRFVDKRPTNFAELLELFLPGEQEEKPV